jgi:GTP cyclohydrolase IA
MDTAAFGPRPCRSWRTGMRVGIDHEAVRRATRELLAARGADLDSQGLRDTPRRMADEYGVLLTPEPVQPDRVSRRRAGGRARRAVSVCVHATPCAAGSRRRPCRLPAWRADPRSLQARPSVRAVRLRLQLQDRLTTQGADWLQEHVEPEGVGVVLQAEHRCGRCETCKAGREDGDFRAARTGARRSARTRLFLRFAGARAR